MIIGCLYRPIREQARSHKVKCIPNVGAGLLAKESTRFD